MCPHFAFLFKNRLRANSCSTHSKPKSITTSPTAHSTCTEWGKASFHFSLLPLFTLSFICDFRPSLFVHFARKEEGCCTCRLNLRFRWALRLNLFQMKLLQSFYHRTLELQMNILGVLLWGPSGDGHQTDRIFEKNVQLWSVVSQQELVDICVPIHSLHPSKAAFEGRLLHPGTVKPVPIRLISFL